jgi:RNA polymerase sigma factor (sigma-70 family)
MRDSEVVEAIVAGDPDGLAEAYDRYAAPLYTYCRSLLREPADAADAVQDTFVIAASKLAGLRDQSRLRPWLYAVARNECHRRLRENASAGTSALDLLPEVSDESADVTGGAERAELRALLRSAVRGLNAGEQDLIELQLRQELDVAEIAAVLGVSRNHAHALLSRARDQLEISLGALLVARSGRADCAALSALLEDWDGQLNVLMRKRINRHIERCPACTERKRRELAPALLLGLAPLAALPVAAVPHGLRAEVLRLASSDAPEAVAHRATVAQRAATFGHHGFPKPLDPPKPAWWRARRAQGAAAAAVVAAAAVLIALALSGGHHGRLSALSRGSSGSTTTAGASSGATAPGTQPASPASPGSSASPTQPAVPASGAAHVSSAPPAGGTPPAGGGPSPSVPPTSHSSSPSSPAPSTSSPTGSATPTATSTATASPPPAPGTLSVTPRTIVLSPLLGGTLTLTASGGPVTWSITESSGLVGRLTVSPSSGRLLAGRSTTVTLSASGAATGLSALAAVGNGVGACVGCQLTVNPGGIKVTVVIDISIGPSSPPPSSGNPDTAAAAERPPARLVN